MRIAHLVSTFPPYRGGIGNVAFHYAQELTLLGEENEIFTPDYEGRRRNADKESQFKIHRLTPWIKYGNAAMVPQLVWKLSSFDVIHIHYPFFGGAEWILLMKWAFIRTPKIVLSYHMDVIGDGALKSFFSMYGKWVLPLLVKNSDAIIVSTRDYGETSLISRFLSQKPVFDIPYGVSEQFHPKQKNEKLISRLNISPENSVLLFVGGLDKAHFFKGVTNLIFAVEKLNNKTIKLILVGNGDLIPFYRNEVRKRGLEDQAVFVTGVTDHELPDYYNLADLVILPSINRSEAFGIVLLEAMACGRPVIASSLPGVRAIVDDLHTGLLVLPDNIESLTEKIKYLLDHFELRDQYGLNGFKKVEDHFRWGLVIQQVRKVYRELLYKPEPAGGTGL
ncbi:MAG: glycosyltransferase family 4 protein [Nitrospiria bacterium]